MPWPSHGIYSRYARLGQDLKINQCNHYINRLKKKSNLITLIDTEKTLDIIQHPFIIKNSQKSRNRGELPQFDKEHLQKLDS